MGSPVRQVYTMISRTGTESHSQGGHMRKIVLAALILAACDSPTAPESVLLEIQVSAAGTYAMTLYDGRTLPVTDSIMYLGNDRVSWNRIESGSLTLRDDSTFTRTLRGHGAFVGHAEQSFTNTQTGRWSASADSVQLRYGQTVERGRLDGATLTFGGDVWVR